MINPRINQAITDAIEAFASKTPIETAEITAALKVVFNAEKDFLEKLNDLDTVFNDYPQVESLREVFFDLLLVNFFSADVKKLEDDYLDSPAWEKIEEKTLDRGTELLNILLYLNECNDEVIEPSLEDYLKEFLLVDDDEFQDEHRIYEQVIANQALMESSLEEIGKVARKIDDNDEIKDLFYPLMTFFYNTQPSEELLQAIEKNSQNPEFDMAVLAIIYNFT